MPRDSNGNYSLPAGNPVATNTPIAISWANGTMSDIATVLTASLDRSGNGAMLAALKLDAGAVGAPGLTFGAETTLGLYRVSAGVMGVAVGGAQVANFSASGLSVTGTVTPSGVVLGANGAVGTPSYSFASDTNLGMYRVGVDQLGFATAGVLRMTVQDANITCTVPFVQAVGSAAAPAYSFTGDTNTGMSAATADTLVLSTGGAARLTINATNAQFGPELLAPNGTNTLPSYAFTNDADCGMYRVGANNVGFATNGVLRFDISTTVITSTLEIRGPDGTAASPTFSFTNDSNTGIYSPSANELGMSLGGEALLVGFRNIPQNIQAGSYTLVLTDSGRHIYHASGAGAGDIYTIPANATVAYPIGTVLTFVNDDSNSVSIAITTDTMTLAGTTTTGTRTLAENGIATAIKVTSTSWIISGTGLS